MFEMIYNKMDKKDEIENDKMIKSDCMEVILYIKRYCGT